jgi:hypothetical protein
MHGWWWWWPSHSVVIVVTPRRGPDRVITVVSWWRYRSPKVATRGRRIIIGITKIPGRRIASGRKVIAEREISGRGIVPGWLDTIY